MRDLEREWDLDRRVGVDASVTGLLGLMLGVSVDRRFLVIPALAAATLFLQGVRVWHPARPALRRLGARSEDEIDQARYGLKVLRGDFAAMPPVEAAATARARAAWSAVSRPVSTTSGSDPAEAGDDTPDRVRAHSAEARNQRIDARTQHSLVREAARGPEAIGRRLTALGREWDIERYLQTNAGVVSLSGVVLGAFVNRGFLVLPAVVLGFFLQHAVQGWCPPLLVWRRVGVRTRREINREKYALKALRGDFDHAPSAPSEPSGPLDQSLQTR